MIKKCRAVLLPMLLLAAMSAGAGAQTGAPPARRPKPAHELKVATLAPDGSTWMNIMRELDDAVRAETANRVGFKFYPGGVQGDELDVIKKIRIGQLHGGGFTGLGLGEIAADLRVLELPFLFESPAEVDHVHAQLDPTFEQILADKGFVLLGWAEVGFIYLFADRPVRSPEDLKQIKMWLWEGDPLAASFFSAYGISPIPLAVTDVLTALETKLIHGVYCSPLAAIALQWFTRVKTMTDLRLTHGIGGVVIDRKAWEAIPAADRTVVLDFARKHFRKLVERTRQENDESIAVMKQRGIQIVPPDPARVASFQEIGRRVWRAEAGKLYPQSLLDQVTAAVTAARGAGQTPAGKAGTKATGAR
jgi:TRAP-type C4-dicarboxylate transport system substrate-binding protein